MERSDDLSEIRRITQEEAHPRRLGRYQIVGHVGTGGMGCVYKAFDDKLCRVVALKVLSSRIERNTKNLRRLAKEAQVMARLQHPGVATIFDFNHDDGHCYIAMEYIGGISLAERIDKSEIPFTRSASWISQIATTLHYIHRQGALHLDLKPANIILRDDNPVVVDFGLGKALDIQSTSGYALAGTVPYMAPEQVEGDRKALDQRTDIYGLGTIFYELLTGSPPFDCKSPFVLAEQPLVSPRKKRPEIPAELERICIKCLEKEPAKRYQSVRRVARELDVYLQPNSRRKALPLLLIAFALFIASLIVVVSSYLPTASTDPPLPKSPIIIYSPSKKWQQAQIMLDELAQWPIATTNFPKLDKKYSQIVNIAPHYGTVYRRWGQALFHHSILQKGERQRNYFLDEALQKLDKAIELDPQDHLAIHLAYLVCEYHSEISAKAYGYLAKDQPLLAAILQDLGHNAQQPKKIHQAISHCKQTLSSGPGQSVLYYLQIKLLLLQRQYQQALLCCEQLRQAKPKNLYWLELRAFIHYKRDDYSAAKINFDQLLDLAPNYAPAFYQRAKSYHRLQQYRQALEDLKTAAQLGHSPEQCAQISFEIHNERQQYKLALVDSDKLIQLNPKVGKYYFQRARTYMYLQRYRKSLRDFEQALLFDPENKKIMILRDTMRQAIGE